MKGLELPINAIVIIVIVVTVLLAVTSLFLGVYTPSSSSTSLQSATTSTCLRVNPELCEYSEMNIIIAARMPVYDFDANENGVVNEHHPNPPSATSYCIDDNLEMLCYKYYGCKGNANCYPNLQNEQDYMEWHSCCLKQVCGCP